MWDLIVSVPDHCLSFYLKPYYYHWPNIHKFEPLMSLTSKKLTCSLAKFIYFATKKRVS